MRSLFLDNRQTAICLAAALARSHLKTWSSRHQAIGDEGFKCDRSSLTSRNGRRSLEQESDRYQLVNVGWKDSSTRLYGCVLHVDIKDGKIWVQHDGPQEAIAEQLVVRGVPKPDIVLAYHAPHVRQYTEWWGNIEVNLYC